MTNQYESDPTAVEETLEIVGSDVMDTLARAAHEHNVIINLNIMPNSDSEADEADSA